MHVSRLALAACSLAILAPHAVLAQDAAPQADATPAGSTDSDIVVTARRTAERLQDVPVAVTALTGAAIENRHLNTVADIQAATPSLNFTSTNGQAAKSAVSLRGQRQSGSGIGVDPSVGVYINELYIARATIDTALYDLDSVQILKGPQGTLFGRNTTGGAVLLATKRPGDELGGYVKAQVETPWGYQIEGAVNVPLGEGNGLRIAGLRQYRQGYSKAVNRGIDLDDRKRWGLRGTLKLSSGDFETLFIGDYYTWDENGFANFPLSYANPPVNAAAFTTARNAQFAANFLEKRQNESSAPLFSRGHTWSALNTTTYQLTDEILLKNVLGVAASYDSNLIEYDGTAVNILSTGVSANQHQFSEEFQIQGKSFDGALDWIAGAYYFHEWGYDHGGAFAFIDPTLPQTGSRNTFDADNKAISVFAHASYLLPIDGLTSHIFGGVRRGRDTRFISFQTYRANNGTPSQGTGFTCLVAGAPGTPVALGGQGIPGGECRLDARKKYPSTTWDIGVDVKPIDDLLLYGSLSRGYRTGGFNGRATNATSQIPFNPERVLNYEAGLKYSGFIGDMHATLNVAAYHSNYTNIQLNQIAPGLISTITNAGKGRVNGLEVEASVRPVDTLTLSAFYSLTDAKYTQFIYQTTPLIDLVNNRFAGVPRNQFGASVDWDIIEAEGFGKLHLNANMRYNGAFYLDPIFQKPNFPNYTPEAIIASYTVFNAGLRLEEAFGSRATVEVYVKNIGDRTYGNGGFASYGSGFASRTLGDPRVFGMSLKLPFGGE